MSKGFDLENAILWLMCQSESNFETIVMSGVDGEGFSVDAKRAFEFALSYHAKYDRPISVEALKAMIGLELRDPKVEIDFVIDEIDNSRRHLAVVTRVHHVESLLKQGRVEDAVSALTLDLSEASSTRKVKTSVFDAAGKVLENYNDEDAWRNSSVALPWPSLQKIANGLLKGTMTVVASRPGVGKTMLSVIASRFAFENNCKVLFISPEMSKLEIAERLCVLFAQVSYDRLVKHELTGVEEDILKETIEYWGGRSRELLDKFLIMDSVEDVLDAKSISRAVMEMRPDLLVIDSAYSLTFGGKTRHERMPGIVEFVLKLTKKVGCATILVSQETKDAEKDEKFGGGHRLGGLAFSDTLAHDAAMVWILSQTPDQKQARELEVKPQKVRRGYYDGTPIVLNWDFDLMNFSEKPVRKYVDSGIM